MKLNKENNGITLVALVITIIILLILAGITIAQLTENGLFENTKLAKEKYQNAEIKENAILGDYENKVGEYIDGSRQSGNVPVGSTLLWSYKNDQDGILAKAGATDGTSEKNFSEYSEYNVNDFDAIIVDAGYYIENPNVTYIQPLYISKLDFDEEISGILTISSSLGEANYQVKIDSTNNKICFVRSSTYVIGIRKVIGIKY